MDTKKLRQKILGRKSIESIRSKTDLAADVGLYVLKEIQTKSITPGDSSGRYFSKTLTINTE